MTPRRPSLIATLGALPITAACLTYGGVTHTGRAALGPLLGLCIIGLVLHARKAPLPPWPLTLPSIALAALFGAQLVPLPDGVVAALSPISFEHRALLPEPLQGAATLSAVDPVGRRLLPFFLLALAFPWALYHALGRPKDRGGLAAGLAILSALGGALFLIQTALGGGAIYPFLREPLQGKGPNAFGFFINPNHGGLFSAVGALLAAGLCIEVARRGKTKAPSSPTQTGPRRRKRRRSSKGRGLGRPSIPSVLWGGLSLSLCGLTLASGSQGALFALFGGGALALFALGSSQGKGQVQTATVAGLVGLLGLIMATGVGRLLHLVESLTGAEAGALERRLEIWEGALGLIARAPIAGSGLGSHPFIGPLTQNFRANIRADFVHNDALELGVEAGILGLLILTLALAILTAALRRGSWRTTPQPYLTCAAFGALGAILLQSLVEFPFQIPALTLLAGGVLALLLASLAPPTTKAPNLFLPVAIAFGLSAVGILGAVQRYEALGAEAQVRSILAEAPGPAPLPNSSPDPGASDLAPDAMTALAPALLDKLGDGARESAKADIDNAGGHLLRALALHQQGAALLPSSGALHRSEGLDRLYLGDNAGAEAALLRGTTVNPGTTASWWALARFYRLTGDNDAAIEAYKTAILRGDPQRIEGILREVRVFQDPGPLVQERDAVGLLTLSLWYRRRGERRSARDTLLKVLAVTPGEPRALEPLIQLELGRGEILAARGHLQDFKESNPPEDILYRLEGDMLVAEGDVTHALAYHRKALSSGQRTGDALRVMADLIALERWEAARSHGESWLSQPREGTPFQERELMELLRSLPPASDHGTP